jgi:hypothetical protein
MTDTKTNYPFLLVVTIIASALTLLILANSGMQTTGAIKHNMTENKNETALYRLMQVANTKVIYPKNTSPSQLNIVKEIVEKNYGSEKYVAIKEVAANFNGDDYPDAVVVVYSKLGQSRIDKGSDSNHIFVNTDPRRVLSSANFDTVSADKGCVFIVLGEAGDAITISSSKCLYEKTDEDIYDIKYLNYGSSETDVQVMDLNTDGIDDIVRFGMSTDLYTNGEFRSISAIFQTLSDKYELIDLAPTNTTDNIQGIHTSEEIEDASNGTSYDSTDYISIYKYNNNGYVYILNRTSDHSEQSGFNESCYAVSWKWQGHNSFTYDKKESERKTKTECK